MIKRLRMFFSDDYPFSVAQGLILLDLVMLQRLGRYSENRGLHSSLPSNSLLKR